jgi:pimeloyl-ACP methyl ester carboxylesterase
MGYLLEHQLPNARLMVIPDCKHAPNLECPKECARLIREADRHIAARTLSPQRLVTTVP